MYLLIEYYNAKSLPTVAMFKQYLPSHQFRAIINLSAETINFIFLVQETTL